MTRYLRLSLPPLISLLLRVELEVALLELLLLPSYLPLPRLFKQLILLLFERGDDRSAFPIAKVEDDRWLLIH